MKPANSFNELYAQLYTRKFSFLIAFFFVILATYAVLFIIDFVPDTADHYKDKDNKGTIIDNTDKQSELTPVSASISTKVAVASELESEEVDELPIKIFIDKLDREVKVLNPTENTIEVMDKDLKRGVVRHPDSADFGKVGNIFLLGHSSYMPNVLNKNYQAFNGIEKLTWGDKIRVQSGDTEYVYRVDTVKEERATDAVVPYTWGEAKLTLVTCKVLGATEDRFVVVATLISTQKL